MALALFDLCETLYATNTTHGFLAHLGKKRPKIARTLHRWTSRTAPTFWLGALAYRLGRDIGRKQIVAALAGIEREELEAAAREYARTGLPALRNTALHESLAAHRAAGDRILILSNSLAPVVTAIARELGVEGRGSALGYVEDRCTGRIVDDLTGRKSEVAIALRQSGERMIVYTDNRSDADLLALADERHVVLPVGRSRHRWAGEDCRYVEL